MAPSLVQSSFLDPKELYYSKPIQEKHPIKCLKPTATTRKAPEADIGFHPNIVQFRERTEASLYNGSLQTEVPKGWPETLKGPLVWEGTDFSDESRFVYHLTKSNLAEIKSALDYFKDQGLHREAVRRQSFPLPKLGPRLTQACEQVYAGIGFVVFRGLNVDDYTPEDVVTIFLGVSSHIAGKRGVQDRNGNVLKHLMDNGKLDSHVELPFHTDITCDIVATVTRKCSEKGGMCTLASSWTVYNDLAATRPDLLHVLARADWPFDTYGRNPPYYLRPLLFHTACSKIILNFSRRVLTGHPLALRTPNIPRLSESQAEALDAVHFSAQKHQLKITMEKGDMRFINNMGLLHGREAFCDDGWDGDGLSQRHLIRAWLNNPDKMWKLPPELELAWARVFEDDERVTRWDVEPRRVNGVPMWRSSSPCD